MADEREHMPASKIPPRMLDYRGGNPATGTIQVSLIMYVIAFVTLLAVALVLRFLLLTRC